MSTTQILLLGATGTVYSPDAITTSLQLFIHLGYIGGTVLARLLDLKRQSVHITILVRSASKAAKFNAIPEYTNKLVAVVGSLDEESKLETLAQKAEYVVNCVSREDWN